MSESRVALEEVDYINYPPEGSVLVEFYGDQVSHVLYGEKLILTQREVKELEHCLYYAEKCHHGADGHNRMMLVAKMAKALGMELARTEGVLIPSLYVGETICE